MIDLTGIELNNSYKIIEKLGENKIYTIYSAEGIFSPMKFIIKILNYKKSDFRNIEYLLYEKEVLSVYKINHPNLVRIFEIDQYKDHPFISTEYIEGFSLSYLLSSGKIFTYEEAFFIITEITKGISAAHHNGAIHKNLNPLNIVLIYDDNKLINVKIKNFGFYILNYLYNSTYEEIKDNFKYIACEGFNLIDENIGQRSDLYSIGVLFYRLLTGETPFNGNDMESLFIEHLKGYNDLLEKNYPSNIPPITIKIIKKLLQKDKYNRYQSAEGLLADLEKINNGEKDFMLAVEEEYNFEAFVCSLTDREKEFNILKESFENIKVNKKSLIIINGEIGSGKTFLINEFGKTALINSCHFLKGEYFSVNFSYQAFYEALMRFLIVYKLNNKDQQKKLSDLFDESLKFNNTVLLKKFEFLNDIISVNKNDNNNLDLTEALSEFIVNISIINKPVVFFLDNAENIDNDSIELIKRIFKSDTGNIMIILSINEGQKKFDVDTFKDINNESIKIINLINFNKNQTEEYISNMLFEKNKKVSKEISKDIFNKSKGNPFEIIEYLRYYMDNGIIFQYFDEWKIDKNKIKKIPDITFDGMILKRLQGLRNNELTILSYLASLEYKFCLEVFFKFNEFNTMDIFEILDHLYNLKFVIKDNFNECLVYKIPDKIKIVLKQKILGAKIKDINSKITDIIDNSINGESKNIFFKYYEKILIESLKL